MTRINLKDLQEKTRKELKELKQYHDFFGTLTGVFIDLYKQFITPEDVAKLNGYYNEFTLCKLFIDRRSEVHKIIILPSLLRRFNQDYGLSLDPFPPINLHPED